MNRHYRTFRLLLAAAVFLVSGTTRGSVALVSDAVGAGNLPLKPARLLLAAQPDAAKAIAPDMAESSGFIENVGQVLDCEGKQREDLLFTTGAGSARVFFSRDKISYVFLKFSEDAAENGGEAPFPGVLTPRSPSSSYRMDMELLGASSRLTVRAEGMRPDHSMHYCAGRDARIARSYDRIVYENIYPNIDLVFRTSEKGMKYEFVVHPGGNPSDIRLGFNGAGSVTVLGDGALLVENPFGRVTEATPFSYQTPNPGDPYDTGMPKVRTAFIYENDLVRFETGAYDPALSLVIDPTVQWSTYYGGTNEDHGMSVASDPAGNVIVAGFTYSTNFPITAGAVQTVNAGAIDAFIVKFNGAGVRQWSTYFGGAGDDMAYSVAADAAGNIAVGGSSTSNVFPATPGAYQMLNRGMADAFLARFNSAGQLLWATLLGGSSDDNAYGIASDAAGNILVTGATLSINFPTAGGAYQSAYAGYGDAFISRFSNAGALLWSTYYGGSLEETGRAVAFDLSGHVLVAGGTRSTNFPVSTGAFQTAQAGLGDAFVVKLDGGGARQWATYLGGSAFDLAYGIAADTGRRIAVAGVTASDNLPVSPQAYRAFRSGGDEAFLFVLAPTGIRDWATYYGGNLDDVAYGVCADMQGNFAIGGRTESPNFPVSTNTIQNAKSGTIDAYAVKFSPSGNRLWGTFYGGAAEDAASGIAMQFSGNILLAGWTASTDFPVQSAHQQFISRGHDAFAVKICDVKPVIAVNGPTNICHGASVTLDAGPGYSSYLWSTGASTRAITVGRSGKYAVKVADGYGCDGTSDSVQVNVGALLVADAGVDTSICPGSTARLGGATAGGVGPMSYHWTPAAGLSDSTAAFPIAAPSGTTKYFLTVTDSYNCVSVDSITVAVFNSPVVSAGPDTVICRGSSVQIGNTASGGTAPYTYSWTPAAGLSATNIAAPTAAPAVSTTYHVLVTDANGCTAADSVSVSVARVTADAGDDKSICSGDTVRIGGPLVITRVPRTYSWSPAVGLSATDVARPFAYPASSTAYILTVTDSLGCHDTDTVTVHVYGTLAGLAGEDKSICLGTSTTIGDTAVCGTPPYVFRWRPLAGLNDSTIMRPVASPSVTTTYYLRVTDAAMSTVYDTMTVTVNSNPVAGAGPDSLICAGETVRIGSVPVTGTPPYTYFWTPSLGLSADNVARPFASPDVTTTYIFTVIDANGCEGVDSVEIRISDLAIDAGVDESICFGDTAQLLATAQGGYTAARYSYSWSPSAGLSSTTVRDPRALPSATTLYFVTVMDGKGCTATDSVWVIVNTPPSVDAGPDQLVCRLEATQIGSPATGGKPPYTYRWSPPGGLSAVNVAQPIVRAADSATYYVLVTDANGCTATDSVRVRLHPQPIADAGPNRTVCWGDSVQIGELASGGARPYSYKWSPVIGLSDTNAARPWAAPLTPTMYTVTVTDDNGCRSTDQVFVGVTLRPTPQIKVEGSLPICEGGVISMSVDSSRQFDGYRWYRDSVFIDTARRITVGEAGGYFVEVNTLAGCKGASPPVVVNAIPLPRPRVVASGPLTFCEGTSVILESDSVYPWTFVWSNGVRGRRLVVTRSGDYFVTVTGANGCVNNSPTFTVTVNPRPHPQIAADGNTEFCQGGSVTLDADPAGVFKTYLWSNGAQTRTITVSSSGKFAVTVTDDNGCSGTSDSIVVKVNPLPSPRISASGPLTFCLGNEVTLDAGAGYARYLWSTGEGTRTIRADYPGTFSVTVWTAAGCSATSASVTVKVNPLPQPLILPQGPTAFCQGDSVRLDAGSGYSSYQWSNGRTTRIITVKNAGNYTVTVRDAAGCRGTSAAVAVTVFPAPRPTITAGGPTSFCAGDSVILDAGEGYASYAWSTGAGSRRITVKTSGSYTVTVTNAAGCVGTSTPVAVVRYATPVPVITAAGPLRFCEGGSVELDAGPGWQSYLWSTGARTRRITVSQSGLYNVRVTNQNNCSGESGVVEVQVKPNPPIPLITQSGNTLICTPSARYQWNLSGAPITGATQRTYNPTVNGQYTVTVWNADTCSSTSGPYDYRATGVEDVRSVSSFSVFPDPNQGQVTVELQLSSPAAIKLLVLDMLGREMAGFEDYAGEETYLRRLDLRHLPDGLYFLQVHAGKQALFRKILKQ